MEILEVIICKRIKIVAKNEARFIQPGIGEVAMDLGSVLKLDLGIIGAPFEGEETLEVILEHRGDDDTWSEVKGVQKVMGPESEIWLAPLRCRDHFTIKESGEYRFVVQYPDDQERMSRMVLPLTIWSRGVWPKTTYRPKSRLLVD